MNLKHPDQGRRLNHLLIDALSVNNLSGRYVLVGHLRQMVAALGDRYRFTVLVGQANSGLLGDLPEGVRHHVVPVGAGWLGRSVWTAMNLGRLGRELEADGIFSPSGMMTAGARCAQVVLAQNPWPLVPGMASGTGRIKAWIQRRAFGRAHSNAAVMVFNSRHVQDLYRSTFGVRRGKSLIAYQGIDEALFELGQSPTPLAGRSTSVLCVSVMARHKAIEVLVDAFGRLARDVPDASLALVGAWPEAKYRAEIESLIDALGLSAKVKLEGHVATPELHRLYGNARVFCLLSRCESFGIPALEAQAFGTPVVVAEGTAAPEIVGAGGIAVPPDDPVAAAEALTRLLSDAETWTTCSELARLNAGRFHWPACSAPLVDALVALGRDHD